VFDFRRLRQHLPLAALPYIVGFGLWALYISRSGGVSAQFGMNAAGRDQGFHSPITQMVRKSGSLSRANVPAALPPRARRASVLIPILYAFSVMALVLRRKASSLGILAMLYFVIFEFWRPPNPRFIWCTLLRSGCVPGAVGLAGMERRRRTAVGGGRRL
jgi:hypothetical protein